ncbi:hypothetical protein ACTFIW_006618 [Dictyostelium discoideum]
MGDFNSNEDNNNNPFNNVLYNPYIVDLYDSTNNNNNNNNNIIGGFNCDSSIFTQQITNTNNELTIPLTQSIQNLLPPVQQQQQPQLFITPNNNSNNNNNNNDINTSIDINLNQLVYSTPSQQITNSVQPIYQCVTQSTTSNIDTNINTINDNNNNNNNSNNNNNNSVNNNNNLLSMCQDPTLILQIQQLLLQQQLLQQAQQQSVPLNIQVPTTTITTPINQQHQALLVPQQKQFYGNVSDNSSPETNFSYASPSSPSSTQSQSSPYEQQPLSPNSTISLSSSISVTASTTTTTKPSTTEKTKESSLKSKSKSNEKEKEDEEDDDDDDRPKKRKKFDKNVYKGVDLGDDLLEITSEEFQAYKNNFFANASDKKTVSALNYQFRKIKNRESARRSRERKATHVDELEAKIAEIEKERDNYKKENERLRMELDQYKLQEKQKSAGSIFDYISIGSPTTQNFSKNFGIILFLFLFGSFILTNTTPNFFNTNNGVINPNLVYNANSNINNNNNNNVNRFSVNGVHSTQQYFQSQRNPLSNLDEDSLESLTASQGVFSTHFVPEQPSILLNRESIRNWATLPQNSVASLSFEKDNALKTIENANLDKSKHNVISNLNQLQQQQPSSDELMIDQKEEKNCNNNNNNNENNNDNDNNKNSDDDEKGKEIEEIKRKSSTTTISPTRYVNNSTISLLINPTSVIGDIPDDLMKNSNVTTFGENSSFKFNFLIDTQNFPNGSNDISKAFFDNENQQMTVTSVIIAIQKSPKTPTQQPSTK